jgi:allophanate hydrolase
MIADGDPLEIGPLRNDFVAGALSVVRLVDRILNRITQLNDPAIWISRTNEGEVRGRARALDAAAAADPSVFERLPLFGIPFAVKDNIDVAGMPTTAGCPAFAYVPSQTAPVVARLLAAGAVLLGKTNLDQFATGLVGTRSPYGVPRNPFDPRFIPGGSSSGSAVAVATGLVSFALGTDTAGSGRIPAAFNNIVGLKPTRGLLSTRGIVPACRSLDCVSVLALTARDASAVFEAAASFDPEDPLARSPDWDTQAAPRFGSRFRFGVAAQRDIDFFGDQATGALFGAAIRKLEAAGGTRMETSFTPFRDAGRLLYGGPWVAERLHATEKLLHDDPTALLPVTRFIIESGRRYSALDAHRAQYDLAALRRAVDRVFASFDVLLLPTAGTIYEIAEIEAEPLRLNANLGLYTSFVNLLDLAAIALPAGFDARGLPFGISLIAPAFRDRALVDLGTRFQEITGLPPGAVQSSAAAFSVRTTGAA